MEALSINRDQGVEPSSDRFSTFSPQATEPEPAWTTRNLAPIDNPPVIEVVEEESFPTIERRSTSDSADKAKSVASGLGTVALVLVVILFKAGPKLLREVFRDRPQQQPPPVHVNQDHAQEIRKMRQELEERMAKHRLEKQGQFNAPPNVPPNQ